MKITFIVLSITACLLISPAQAEPIYVTVTIFPIADIVKQVGGGEVEVYTLLKPGQGPHSYEPTPGAAKKIERSKLVVMVGFGLDHWLEGLIESTGDGKAKIIDLSETVKKVIKAKEYGHDQGGANPHYWLDPVIMVEVAGALGDILASSVPDKADEIKKRTREVKAKLLKLDSKIKARLKNAKGSFVAFHNSWVYFARRYGLNQAGVIEEAPGRKPSAKRIAALVRKIKASKAKAVMVEPQFSPRLGLMLAGEAGISVDMVDPIGGVKGRSNYFELMRWNAERFYEALK